MSEQEHSEEMELGSDLLTLVDEEGVEHTFEMADNAELDGQNYVALVPVFDAPEELLEDSGELVILRVPQENGEEFLDAIEDEEEFNRVGDFFMQRLSDLYDFEEPDEKDS